MSTAEELASITPESARELVKEYDDAYDVLDAQGQSNPWQIHAILEKRFFGVSAAPGSELRRLRALADKAAAPVLTEAATVVEKVADATARLVEPVQTSLFLSEPSPIAEVLRPKTEMELNFEDFEAAWNLANANPRKPEFLEFETVIGGQPKLCQIAWVVARTVLMPSSRAVRTLVLKRQLQPEAYVE